MILRPSIIVGPEPAQPIDRPLFLSQILRSLAQQVGRGAGSKHVCVGSSPLQCPGAVPECSAKQVTPPPLLQRQGTYFTDEWRSPVAVADICRACEVLIAREPGALQHR